MSPPTLIGVAHGSRDPAAGHTVRALLAEVSRRRPGLDVRSAFLDHGRPTVDEVVAVVTGPAVAVPLLLTAAFHTGVDLPARLAGAGGAVQQADALGPHPLLQRALTRRLAEAGVRAGDPGTAVVLAAAGSTSQAATRVVEGLAGEWATAGWWAVVPAFVSAASPTPADAVAALRARGAPRVAVAAYLLSPGRFADALHACGADVVGAPLGPAPEVADVVLHRYDVAAAQMITAP